MLCRFRVRALYKRHSPDKQCFKIGRQIAKIMASMKHENNIYCFLQRDFHVLKAFIGFKAIVAYSTPNIQLRG